ncbi:Condensin-2 complex subunit H2 [Gracilaria domingensis]|nr:Condensin-2 complex subunit H2 [Gracilaria domingensis]
MQHYAEAPSFSVLLKPIRDLATSWNVDIAEELTQYAATLGINLDDEASSEPLENAVQIDFAHAALLVQGSTSIYSRKVEHLLNLVYTAVASLGQLKSSKDAGREDADDDSVEEDEFQEDEVSFLTLDDCLPEIDESRVTLAPKKLPAPGSLQDKTCLKRIPQMLVQHGSDAAQIASAKFNLLSARLHPSGALIMPGCPPFDENLQALPEGSQALIMEHQNQISNLEQKDITQSTSIDVDDDGFCTPPPVDGLDGGEEILVAVASSAKKRRSPDGSPADKEIEPPKRDPFLLLDPHQKIPELDKELRVGKTYEMPRKTRAAKPYIGFFDNGMSKRELMDALLGPIPRGTSIRSYLCFEGARDDLQDILRRRRAKKRQLKARNSPTAVILDQNREMFDDMEEEEDFNQMGMNTVTFDVDDDDDEIDIPSYPDMNEAEDGMEAPMNEMEHLNDGSCPPQVTEDQLHRLASSYEETCRKYLERTRGLWEQHSVDAKLAKRVESWAFRIRPILDEEEKRPEFDIVAYGKRIVSQFRERHEKQGVNELPMSAMFQGCNKYDVCRNFLATLQLANSHSVEIVPPSECSVSDPKLRLICKAPRATTPVISRSKRVRESGGTPLTARRAPLRQRLNV